MVIEKIKKNDTVIVLIGRDRGKTGVVLSIDNQRVLVEGVNVVSKTVKRNPEKGEQGGMKKMEKSIDRSNVALYSIEEKRAVKVGIKKLADGKRVRYDKRSGEQIDHE